MADSPTRRLEAYTQMAINGVMFWVYILQCSDKSYYTGHTDHLESRFAQHQNKMISSCYTSTRLPVQLMHSQEFTTREEALIKGDWHALSAYASRRRVDLPTKP